MSKQTMAKIKKSLDQIRPHLQRDDGDVEFIDFDDKKGILKVSLKGACIGCPMSQITLQDGIGRAIKEKISEVKEVVLAQNS